MPYPLNNYTTTNSYSSTGEAVISPPKSGVSMLVTNAAVYYQLAPARDGHALSAAYQPEVFAPPGRYKFLDSDAPPYGKVALLQVRSAVVDVPAQVSIS